MLQLQVAFARKDDTAPLAKVRDFSQPIGFTARLDTSGIEKSFEGNRFVYDFLGTCRADMLEFAAQTGFALTDTQSRILLYDSGPRSSATLLSQDDAIALAAFVGRWEDERYEAVHTTALEQSIEDEAAVAAGRAPSYEAD